jgi:hypothetical protein
MTEEQATGTLHNHMMIWLHNSVPASKLKAEFEDPAFKKKLLSYLDRIIRQGFMDDESVDEDLNVSEVSCKPPVNPKEHDFARKLKDDVNKLVKVANMHSCRGTCFKYGKTKKCRFEYPRELIAESKIEENKIKLKRTHEMVNNYNPLLMTCIRSNHDIKFIPSGKDGKDIAFYVSNYATKSSLSTYEMVPMMAASKKRLDADPLHATRDNVSKSKAMITKCLNKITTHTEISGSHVCHLLLGHLDKKTSHNFTGLNLQCFWAWLLKETKRFEDLSEAYPLIDDAQNIDNGINDEGNDGSNNDNTNNDDDDNDENNDESFTLSRGNTGLVFVNQMTDYLNRGDSLKSMCLYDYCAKVYKCKVTEEEKKKHDAKKAKNKLPSRYEQRHLFSISHPQSDTHWQKVRLDGNVMVPSPTQLPPNSKDNKLKYQKCILLLFKPFTKFEDLYNGISWDETFSEFLEITEHKQYIDNIQEMHISMDDKQLNDLNVDGNDNDNELVDDEEDDDITQLNATDDGVSFETTDALNIIQNTTPWVNEAVTNHQTVQSVQPELQTDCSSTLIKTWENDLEKQNSDKTNDEDDDDLVNQNDPSTTPVLIHELPDDNTVDVTLQASTETDDDSYEEIAENIIEKFQLNKKQKVAFRTAVKNVIKRRNGEQTEQIIGYVGGPGGTGKSQVIKAIVDFHKKIGKKNTLKLCAPTGTAAKNIGGSTTNSLFEFSCDKRATKSVKLQNKLRKVETIILDEVSMVGCYDLLKISKALNEGKCVDSSLAFGGVDIIFFGDFIQFSPVRDPALYSGWYDEKHKRKLMQKKSAQTLINWNLGINLWKQVNHIILLDQQMRVQDKAYLDMLNRLRDGKCTDQDILMIKSRVVGQNVSCITSIADTPIIVPGNELVTAVNNLFVTPHSLHTNVYTSTALDYIAGKKKVPKNVAKLMKNWPATRTQGLPGELQIYVGMPVVVSTNVKVELGITNGTSGVIRAIQLNNAEVITEDTGIHNLEHPPECIIVEMDDIDVEPLEGLPANHIPITMTKSKRPIQVTVGQTASGKPKKVNVTREHFPLVPSFSYTAHKSQGKTLPKVVVDLRPSNTKNKVKIEFAYVPLSRVRRLEDLNILRPFNPCVLKAQVNQGCAAMMEEFKARDLCKDL